MIGAVEGFGVRREPPVADLDLRRRMIEQVGGPLRAHAGGDEDRSIRLVDVADRDGSRQAGPPAASRQPRDLALEEEIRPDAVRRQRARCQDLPSVCVDGA